MKLYDDQKTVIEFKIPPPEIDPYKALEEFFESSAHGSNRDVVLEYVGILVSAMQKEQRTSEAQGHT